jgi:hypothetical protein
VREVPLPREVRHELLRVQRAPMGQNWSPLGPLKVLPAAWKGTRGAGARRAVWGCRSISH